MSSFFFLAGAFIANGIANVLLKLGAERGILMDFSMSIPRLLLHHAYVIGGFVLFAVNLGFYFIALRTLPLSIAYPILIAMTVIITSGTAVLFLHESISLPQILGYILILGGITLVIGFAR